MLKNAILTSFRALWKSRSTFFLNILGLSLGICACVLAYLHVSYELSYDGYYEKKDQLHRLVVGNMATGEGWVKVAAPIPPKLAKDIPEIETYGRLTQYSYNQKVAVAHEDLIYNERHIYMADPSLFGMLDIEMVKGGVPKNPAKNSLFISSVAAAKVFGEADPIGKMIEINGDRKYVVQGVFPSLPENSHLELDYVVPFDNLEEVLPGTSLTANWGQFNYFAYIQLKPNASIEEVVGKIKETVVEFGDNQEMRFENLTLQPITDIHFQASGGNVKASYDSKYLFIYTSIALAIFIISVINFMNLSIAGSTKRIREVGIRKVMGANRRQIIFQFVMEGVILSSFSIVLGLLVTYSSLPFVNNLVGSQSTFNFTDPFLISILAGLVLFIALISGLYITFFVISFHPIRALKGTLKLGSGGNRFKNSLLIVQFVMSSVLILSSIMIYKQLDYLKNTELGLNEEQVLTIELFDESSRAKMETLAAEMEKLPGVVNTATSRFTPGEPNWNQTVKWAGQKEAVNWHIIEAGPGFLETYGTTLLSGNLEAIESSIENSRFVYVVNEAAVRSGGWENGLGQPIAAYGSNSNAPIQGVVKDFHYQSLHNFIEPMVLVIRKDKRHNLLSLKLETDQYLTLLEEIKASYTDVMGNTPFEYVFVDDQFEALYQVEEQTSQLVGLLTFVAIVLATLGMYALLSFAVKERTKEIAIRKVLGIRLMETLFLLSRKYFVLLIGANIVGIGVTWYMIDKWLNNFSYHISINLFTMVAASLSTFLIVILVVGSKTFQTERINPTDALRNE